MAFAEFRRDQCTDLAAALTYYAIGAVIPALVVLVALVGVVGDPAKTAETVVNLIRDIGQQDVAEDLRDPINNLTGSRAAGPALVFGLVAALWSASGYVGAFGRAMNRIYEIDEGRRFWKLRLVNLVVTLALLIGTAVMLLGIATSGPLAREIGDRLGLSDAFVTGWNIGRWPLMLVVMALMVALLYYATPNVQQPKFRWISVGAGLAMLIWLVGSIAFAFYVNQFGSYDKTYGSLAGLFVGLLWIYITNLALLFGAEFDSELERARELEAGMPAEEVLQLPPRDTKGSKKSAEKLREDVEKGRKIRRHSERVRREQARRRVVEHRPPPGSRGARLIGAFVLLGALVTGGGKRHSATST